jgi:hypothetical protein
MVSRRVRAGDPHPLPRWSSFWDYLKGWWGCLVHGVFLWVVWFIYELPGLILAIVLFLKTIWIVISKIWEYTPKAMAWLQGSPSTEPETPMTAAKLWSMGVDFTTDFLVQKSIILAISTSLIIISHLMFCGGMVRYLNGGSFWVFFHPLKNLWTVIRHWWAFVTMLFFWVVLITLLWLVELLLGAFGVTAPFIPVLFPISFWFVGHLYGQMALKVAMES